MRLKTGLIRRFFVDPKDSFFLFGPRGTGKSTWLKEYYPKALRIDFLDSNILLPYLRNPELLRELVEGNPECKVVVLDEVQKAPELLNTVHALMEERPDIVFVLTGSSARKLKKTGVNLLGGRAQVCSLHPFMAKELGELFVFEEALVQGLLPVVLFSGTPKKRLQAYVSLYLREEVQQEGLVRNVAGFSRFLEVISFSHASLINMSNIAKECHVDRKSVETYLQILEDLLLAYRLPVFKKRASREVAVHPKFYLFDAGVFRSLRPKGPLDKPQEIDGLALEGLVFQHLLAWNSYGGLENQIYFWRTRSGVEVDFILYGPDNFYAIEVKNSAKVSKHDVQPLKSFQEDYPEAKLILLYRGQQKIIVNGVLCLPCDLFLKSLDPKQTELYPESPRAA